jgi:hypothetical protein
MNIRKIAVVGSFAAGAALALAPLAAANPAAPVDPLIGVVSSEISQENSLFQFEATLAGVPSTDYALSSAGFDTILPADIAKDAPATAPFSILDYELFGVSPGLAGVASDPGSFNVFNGAVTEFDDAYNVALYSLLNGGANMTDAAAVTDLIGSSTTIDTALDFGTATQAFDYFWNFAVGDLSGFLQVPLTFLDLPMP